jgi:hypothetical protein
MLLIIKLYHSISKIFTLPFALAIISVFELFFMHILVNWCSTKGIKSGDSWKSVNRYPDFVSKSIENTEIWPFLVPLMIYYMDNQHVMRYLSRSVRISVIDPFDLSILKQVTRLPLKLGWKIYLLWDQTFWFGSLQQAINSTWRTQLSRFSLHEFQIYIFIPRNQFLWRILDHRHPQLRWKFPHRFFRHL